MAWAGLLIAELEVPEDGAAAIFAGALAPGAILPGLALGAEAVTLGALTAPSGAGEVVVPPGALLDMPIDVLPPAGAILPGDTLPGATCGAVVAPVGAGDVAGVVWAHAMPADMINPVEASHI